MIFQVCVQVFHCFVATKGKKGSKVEYIHLSEGTPGWTNLQPSADGEVWRESCILCRCLMGDGVSQNH